MRISQNTVFLIFQLQSMAGLKRLEEYSKWFDERGGSIFIISDKIKTDLETKFENNTYFKVKQSFWDRVFRDQSYIRNLPIDFDEIKFYYLMVFLFMKKLRCKLFPCE